MNKKYALEKAVAEARNFIEQAEELLGEASATTHWMNTNAALRGSVNRKSMDLTRALAEFRKAQCH